MAARGDLRCPGRIAAIESRPCGREHELQIELAPPIDPEDQPHWDVSCTKENDPERYGLDLFRWEEWLAIRVPQSVLEKMSATDVVAHRVWEMTFYGFTQEKIAEDAREFAAEREITEEAALEKREHRKKGKNGAERG